MKGFEEVIVELLAELTKGARETASRTGSQVDLQRHLHYLEALDYVKGHAEFYKREILKECKRCGAMPGDQYRPEHEGWQGHCPVCGKVAKPSDVPVDADLGKPIPNDKERDEVVKALGVDYRYQLVHVCDERTPCCKLLGKGTPLIIFARNRILAPKS